MVFNIFTTMAQFEHCLIQELTQVGLKAVQARGRKGKRPKISPNDPKMKMAKKISKISVSALERCAMP